MTSPPDAPVGDGIEGAALLDRIQGQALPDLGRVHAAIASDASARAANRRIESSLPPRDHVLPVPNGWYAIVGSEVVEPGAQVSLRAVGRELVVYRDEDGQAHVLDAHCAHLGAHLGGGRVVGCRLKCPYHGWEYGPDGRCEVIPYSDARIPSRARVGSYPVDERDGFIFFWFHVAGAAPDYELPSVPEVDDPAWTDAFVWESELVAALQEMAENNVDYAHFRFVHGRDAVPNDLSELHLDGPLSLVEESLGQGMTFTRETFGPGVALLRFPNLMTFLAASTPIDRGNVRLRWHFFFPRAMADAADELITAVVGPYGLEADVPIWRDMQYRDRPVLVKGDGPIAEYRRWYAQFYAGNPGW